MIHFKFEHYLLIDKKTNILAQNQKQAYIILYKHYNNASDYVIVK